MCITWLNGNRLKIDWCKLDVICLGIKLRRLNFIHPKKNKCEDTKRVTRIRKSNKDTQCNGQNKKYKRTNNHLQSNKQTHKTTDRATWTQKHSIKEFEDTNEVIRICKSKKNRQRNGQKIKNKRTNNDL